MPGDDDLPQKTDTSPPKKADRIGIFLQKLAELQKNNIAISFRRGQNILDPLTVEDLIALGLSQETAVLIKAAKNTTGVLNILKNQAFVDGAGEEYSQANDVTKYILASVFNEITYLACHPTEGAMFMGMYGGSIGSTVLIGRGSPDFQNFNLLASKLVPNLETGHLGLKETKTGYSALLSAAASGNIDMVRLLIARGVDVNAVNSDGETAFIVAAKAGSLQIVKELLKVPNINIHVEGRRGNAMTCAARNGFPSIVKEFIDFKEKKRLAVSYADVSALDGAVYGLGALMRTREVGYATLAEEGKDPVRDPSMEETYTKKCKAYIHTISALHSVIKSGGDRIVARASAVYRKISEIDPAALPAGSQEIFQEKLLDILAGSERPSTTFASRFTPGVVSHAEKITKSRHTKGDDGILVR